jgi:hypothetical protein
MFDDDDGEAPRRRRGRPMQVNAELLAQAREKLAAFGGDARRATARQGSARYLTNHEMRTLLHHADADSVASLGSLGRDELVRRVVEMPGAGGSGGGGTDGSGDDDDGEAPQGRGKQPQVNAELLEQARAKLAAFGGDARRATAQQGSARFLTNPELRALLNHARVNGVASLGHDELVRRFVETHPGVGGSSGSGAGGSGEGGSGASGVRCCPGCRAACTATDDYCSECGARVQRTGARRGTRAEETRADSDWESDEEESDEDEELCDLHGE